MITLFKKLQVFRRTVDSVPHYRSRKNYIKRFLSALDEVNRDVNYLFVDIDGKFSPNHVHFELVDIITVSSYCNIDDDFTISVYVAVFGTRVYPCLYYRLNV
ncbi:MAG: hypothetical protein [Microviridae sp.]|nr:MAG: hypothetical protein [Microviridae sp.]